MWDWFSIDWLSWQTLRSFVWADRLYLYGIIGIPVLFLLRWLFYNRGKQKLGLSLNRSELKSSLISYLRFIPPALLFLGITCILFALARPQRVKETTEKYSEGIDIMLAMDISDSMLEKDLEPNRLDAAKNVAREFIKGRFQDRIGLVVFAGEAFSICPLTTDYDMLYQYLDEINNNLIKTAGTAIGSALATCINRLREVNTKSKVTILLSDGDNIGGMLDPIMAADLAKSFGIKVYAIAVGKNTTITNADQTAVDEGTLQKIAQKGNGKFYRATDNKTLRSIFEQINQLEKVQIKDNVFRDVQDYYYIYLNWAIVFLLSAFFFKITFIGNVLED
jgi:Ca-activated chloride channel homolog